MKLAIHLVSRFEDGRLSMATVGGLEGKPKHWILYAKDGKFRISTAGDDTRFGNELFDSPEEALNRVEQEYSN